MEGRRAPGSLRGQERDVEGGLAVSVHAVPLGLGKGDAAEILPIAIRTASRVLSCSPCTPVVTGLTGVCDPLVFSGCRSSALPARSHLHCAKERL